MCSDTVISLRGVGKTFRVYKRPHHRLLQGLFPHRYTSSASHTALENITLDFFKGQTVGIVGRNGAGKSTLLQLISGTMTPTQGDIQVHGRIAALLELGSGFNPEFTGRENVYMNASILGLSREETDRRYNDIVAFADIGSFIDQPVKTYSSGMYVRLAFSVSINVVPEILIVDEALSVGDELFQRKCFHKIKQLQAQGVAIIFVSHSASTVLDICDRAILLGEGRCLMDGDPKDVIDLYHKQLFETQDAANGSAAQAQSASSPMPERHEKHYIEGFGEENINWYQTDGAEISAPHIYDEQGRKVNVLESGKIYTYTYNVRFDQDCQHVGFSMSLQTKNGIQIAGATSADTLLDDVKAGESHTAKFKFRCAMIQGVHFFNAGVTTTGDSGLQYLHRGIDVCAFKVINPTKDSVSGLCRVLEGPTPISITRQNDER